MSFNFVVFVCLLLFIWNLNGKTVSCSWNECSTHKWHSCHNWDSYSKISNLTCIEPKMNHNFSIIGKGSLFDMTKLDKLSYNLHLSVDVIVNGWMLGSANEGNSYEFPLKYGTLYYDPLTFEDNELNLHFTALLLNAIPAVNAKTVFKMYDKPNQKGNCVVCAELKIHIQD